MAWWRARRPEDFDDEIREHVEAEEARLLDRGVTPDEARRRARVAFGGITQAREGFRERSRWRWFETLWQDVRYGARLMRRSPQFSATAAVVLALGIGVNTALFSVIDGLFFRDFHISQPERLVYLQTITPHGRVLASVGQQDAAVLREVAKELADFTAHLNTVAEVSIEGETSRLDGEIVEANYFNLLGVTCERGRTFSAEDDDPSNPDLTVILSHDLWAKRLARDNEVIGKLVRINGRMFRVIGIASEGFQGLASPFRPSKWWVPNNQVAGGRIDLGPIGRLKPGVDVTTLQAVVSTVTPGLVRREWERMSRGSAPVWPWEVYRNKALALAPIRDIDIPSNPEARLVPPAVLAAALAVSALVLVIACANIAGLLLARGTSRAGEVAVRHALGAAGPRLFRQLLTESLLLSGSGALIGVGLAAALVRLFAAVTPETWIPSVSMDVGVLGFAVCLALATTALVGLPAAVRATRVHILRAVGSSAIGSRGSGRSSTRWIVVPQVAVSLIFLVVAAAHGRALWQIETRDLGYRMGGTTAFEISRGRMGLDLWTKGMIRFDPTDAAADRAFARNVVDAITAAPGIDQAATVSWLPLLGPRRDVEKPVLAKSLSSAADLLPITAAEVFVSDAYFDMMAMHLVAGRTFDERDRPYDNSGPRTTVVSSSIAGALGGTDLVGRYIALAASRDTQPDWLQVIGIVNDVEPLLGDGRAQSMVYRVVGQNPFPGFGTLLVRGRGERAELMASVRNATHGVDPSAETTRVRTLAEIAGEILYPRRLATGILATATAVALALACIGLYGIVSYSAAERMREFGIRVTLGATRQDIVRLVLRDGAIVVGAGIGLGLVLAAMALRVTSSVIRGLPSFDVVVFLTVPLALVLAAIVATIWPALRASRIDPAQVIRGE